jgi:hypothetical protein
MPFIFLLRTSRNAILPEWVCAFQWQQVAALTVLDFIILVYDKK